MTLTLGQLYQSTQKNGEIIFVDPYFITNWNLHSFISSSFYLATHFRKIWRITKKYPVKKRCIRKMMILVAFFREYSKIFTEDTYTDYSSRTCIDGCRLGGLKALFNIICWDNGRLAKNFDFQGLISADNCPANSGLWKKYRDDL